MCVPLIEAFTSLYCMPLCLFIQSRSYALKLICQRNRRYVTASLAPLRSLESQPWWSYFFLSLNVFVVVATCLYANIIMLLSFVSIIESLGAFISVTLFLRMDCFVDFFFHHRLRCNWMACCVLIVHSTNCSRKTTSCVRPLNAIKKNFLCDYKLLQTHLNMWWGHLSTV